MDLAHLPTDIAAGLRLIGLLADAPVDRGMLDGMQAAAIVEEASALLGGNRGAGQAPPPGDALGERIIASGWVTASPPTLSLVEGVGDTLRAEIPEQQRGRWVELALQLVDAYAPPDADDPATWATWKRILPHVRRILERAEQEGIPHPTGLLMGEKLGVYLFVSGDTKGAKRCMRRALEIDRGHFGERTVPVAVDLNNLAFVLDARGDSAEAERLYLEAADILTPLAEQEPLKLATALINVAGVLLARDQRDQAEATVRHALALDERHAGPLSRPVGRDLRNLARILRQNRPAEAEALVRRALRADEAASGEHHPDVASDLRLLVRVLGTDAEPATVEPLLRRALEIDREWWGKDDPRLPDELIALGVLAMRRERFDQAGCDYAAALDWWIEHQRLPAGRVLTACKQYVECCGKAGTLDRAAALIERIVPLARQRWGPAADPTLMLMNMLQDVLKRLGKAAEARSILLDLQEAVLRRRTAGGAGSADEINALGLFLKNERGRFEEAEQCYRRALELAPDRALFHGNLAVLLTTCLGRHDEAEDHYRRAIELDPGDGNTLSNYAVLALNIRRDPAAAEQLLRMALERQPADGNFHQNLAVVLIVTNRQDEADEQLAEAWRLQKPDADRITARVLWVKAASERLRGRSASVPFGQLKTLFGSGIAHAPWDTTALAEHLGQHLDEADTGYLGALHRAICSREGFAALAGNPRWAVQPSVDLGEPWDRIEEI